ncbi:MAG: membrane fusion protein (multidrug efflux system) [Candidatus Endobugula sp.]|jgi:membrane fusion protein (multidrug efflux system)
MTKKNSFFTVVGLLLLTVMIAGVKALQIKALIDSGKTMMQPPTTISSADVRAYQWESTLTAIGSLEAAKGLEITADLSGRISKILFNAGAEVSAGDLLVEQEISTEKAQLRSAKSTAALEKNNFERVKQLYSRKVASKSEYDSAENAYQSALADADNIRAAIEKKSIRAPFKGRLGIRLVNLGQSITAGEPVVSLQATDQMFVNFFLPQQNLAKLKAGLVVRISSDAVPDKIFTGKINAINPEIDSATRSVEIQAILANPDGELLSGMFASIVVVLPERSDVLLIPITAVQYATYGDSVFVIEEKSADDKSAEEKVATVNSSEDEQPPAKQLATQETVSTTSSAATVDEISQKIENKTTPQPSLVARQQFVRLGETRGDFIVVTKGLALGERIVNAGGFKLRSGAPVVINNRVVPEFSLTPVLKDQ